MSSGIHKECQNPGFPSSTLHCNQMMINVNCQWFYVEADQCNEEHYGYLTYTATVPPMGQMAQIFFKVPQMSHHNLVTVAGERKFCNVYFFV